MIDYFALALMHGLLLLAVLRLLGRKDLDREEAVAEEAPPPEPKRRKRRRDA